MKTFLNLVANNLLQRFDNDLHNLTIVFPGKRARLFLNEYLLQAAGRPIWAPSSCTLQELFTSLSPYSLVSPIEAICLLHKAYSENLPDSAEPLDSFYSWGEVLLSDFDDIDKHLVNADLLFSNIEDLERLTSDHFITKEQEETLQHFFSTFSVEGNSVIRERFREMWHAMPAIYKTFNQLMRQQGKLTEGALYRDVVDRLQNGSLASSNGVYAFVGFNALSDVEQRLLQHMKTNNQALFYWDYDLAYYKQAGHEATIFMDRNIDMFGNALSGLYFDNLRNTDKHFTYIATAGANEQTTYIPQWLEEHKAGQGVPDTAIVLCDETLLEPVLHSIPDAQHGGPEVANITMGFPITYTHVYSLVRALLRLHTDGWNATTHRMRIAERLNVERNPLIGQDVKDGVLNINVHEDGSLWLVQYIQSILEFVAGRRLEREMSDCDNSHDTQKDTSPEQALLCESLFRAYTTLATIAQLVKDKTLEVDTPCLSRIIDQALTRTSIPFHGEPAEGLQVMGILETRCLDFRNLLMLSVGEGHMPKNDHLPSFIPYSLRAPFGLTTIEHRVGIHAYNFYRLLQRADNVTFVYDTACSQGVKNEMSRFLRQMLVEMRPGGKFPDKALSLKPEQSIAHPVTISAGKTPEAIAKLRQINMLSPSALEEFICCPLKFYLHYIAGVEEFKEQDDEMDSATFGNIFHASVEEIYRQFIGRPLTPDDLNYYLNGKQGERAIGVIVEDKIFELYCEKHQMPREMGTGALSIRRDVIIDYIRGLLQYDLQCLNDNTVEVIGCEYRAKMPFMTTSGQEVTIGGIIDRLDRVTDAKGNAHLRIVDYKTMSRGDNPSVKTSIDDIFLQKRKYHRHIFQTFLYALTLNDQPLPIQPTVFYTQHALAADNTTDILFDGGTITDFKPYAKQFADRLAQVVDNIFDTTQQFGQTTEADRCLYCPFVNICRKQNTI